MNLPPFYDGIVSEERPYRCEAANAPLDYVQKIIVMGGSFNPPTKAHFGPMQSAMNQLTTGASDESVKGVFVPSSNAYVSRKMSRQPSGADKRFAVGGINQSTASLTL